MTGGELVDLISNVDRFVNEIVPSLSPENVFYDVKGQPSSLKQIQQMGDHDPYFQKLITDSPFREVAEALIGGPVVPKNLQYFDKPPQTSKPTPPHQDGYYFMIQPCNAVTMWFALDEVDEENGCVRYVPGSQRQPMRKHSRTTTLGFSQGIAEYPTPSDSEREIAIPASPGDLLVHHAMTIHRADANRSADRSRRSLGFIYYDQQASQDEVAHAAYQRRLTLEMKQQGKL